MRSSVLKHFGVQQLGEYNSDIYIQYKKDIVEAIDNKEMIALVGEAGAGKSHIMNDVKRSFAKLQDRAPIFINILDFDREKLTISNITTQIVQALSSEPVARDRGARSYQIVRLLGQHSQKRKICLVIEESHRLHMNVFRSLKEIREQDFNGITPLFSVVLIGHPMLAVKLEKRKEVFWRSGILQFTQDKGWMNYKEREKYIRQVYGNMISDNARKWIATQFRQPQEINFFLKSKLQATKNAGENQLTENGLELSLQDMKEALQLSYSDIAKITGLGKTTVQNVITGSGSAADSPENQSKIQAALKKAKNFKREAV